MNGLVLIDKPPGLTSHDVVNRWRTLAQTKRAGHLGTLDPMATGLLLVVTGTATRLAQFYGRHEKTYEAEIRLGFTSPSYDAESEIVPTGTPIPAAAAIHAALDSFRGRFLQTPPPVSAKKVGGVPAYKFARKQQPVDLAPVEVEIQRLDVCSIDGGVLRLVVVCSAGTYIRGLAHDLGRLLGCGGLLSALRRTHSGEFSVDAASTLDRLGELATAGQLAGAVLPTAQMLPQFPAVYVDSLVEAQIRQGREFRSSPFTGEPESPFVKAISQAGELVAIGQLKFPNVYHPMLVL